MKSTRDKILITAEKLAAEHSYLTLTRNQVAKAAGVACGLINHHFGTMGGLKISVMVHAVKTGNTVVIAQGLSHGDNIALSASRQLKAAAGKLIASGGVR